jgi:thioredoxin reductase (NADPH)
VCDGSLPIFREKPLVVIGGGDSAVEESIYLTKKASKVTVLVRKDFLRASKANARRLTTNPKVEVRYNTQGVEIKGQEGPRGLMQSMVIKNNKTGETEEIPANGLFYAVGHDPATYLFKDQIKMDEDGYIITTPGTAETSIPGVFAAGDVQDKKYRQAVTSAGKFCSEMTMSHGKKLTLIPRYRLHGRTRVREVPCRARRHRLTGERQRGQEGQAPSRR